MDLWIQTQYGRLVKTIDISQPIEDEFNNMKGWYIYGDNVAGMMRILGCYKTKERALEVIDEIQKFLQPDFKCDGYETETNNNCFNTIKLHFSEPNIFHKRIYEMPKE